MLSKAQKFDVGASVDYPQGMGKLMRYRGGMVLRSNAKFGNSFGTTLMVAGALTGTLVLSSPASVTIKLPADVAEELPDNAKPEVVTLWNLGDQPLLQPGLESGTQRS